VVLFEDLFRVLPEIEEEPCKAPVNIAELGLRSETERRRERPLATEKCINYFGRPPSALKRVN
jgi:hypothetical protein